MTIIMERQSTQPVEAFHPGQDLRPLCLSPLPPEEGLKVLKTFTATFKTGYMEVFEDFVKSFFFFSQEHDSESAGE